VRSEQQGLIGKGARTRIAALTAVLSDCPIYPPQSTHYACGLPWGGGKRQERLFSAGCWSKGKR